MAGTTNAEFVKENRKYIEEQKTDYPNFCHSAVDRLNSACNRLEQLQASHDDLLSACDLANSKIIAAIEIPTNKRLEKDKDNLIYVIRDMSTKVNSGQQILKAAIAKVKESK